MHVPAKGGFSTGGQRERTVTSSMCLELLEERRRRSGNSRLIGVLVEDFLEDVTSRPLLKDD